MFQDVTPVVSLDVNLNSTAVATADVSMSGSVVKCVGGNKVYNFSVGNISLCVLGELCYRFVYTSWLESVVNSLVISLNSNQHSQCMPTSIQ